MEGGVAAVEVTVKVAVSVSPEDRVIEESENRHVKSAGQVLVKTTFPENPFNPPRGSVGWHGGALAGSSLSAVRSSGSPASWTTSTWRLAIGYLHHRL